MSDTWRISSFDVTDEHTVGGVSVTTPAPWEIQADDVVVGDEVVRWFDDDDKPVAVVPIHNLGSAVRVRALVETTQNPQDDTAG